jgi:excinuclease ABC subunit C
MSITKKHTKTIPKAAGVYYFKDTNGTVLYVGKAKSLAHRVNSYFQKGADWKIRMLIEEYADIDYILTKNETEALLLEAQMVGEHKPKYNVLLKEGQPFLYILFTTNDPLPTIQVVRNKGKKGTYFGPFLHKKQARGVAQYLVETFRLKLCNKKIANGCLDYHIGRCAGSCLVTFDSGDYLFRIGLAMDILKKDHKGSLKKLKEKILEYNKKFAFEQSKRLHDYLANLDTIFETIATRFHEKKYEKDIFVATTPTHIVPKDEALQQLSEFLELNSPLVLRSPVRDVSKDTIRTIDCFDISHFQSSYLVGSCVRFSNGVPDKHNFRRFKIKSLTEQNDYAALQEIITRRYRNPEEIPDLILIDGGKGQLSAAQAVLPNALIISIAKREETIFATTLPQGKKLDIHSKVGQLLIAIRDYAHHFAISYHKVRRRKDLKETAGRKK